MTAFTESFLLLFVLLNPFIMSVYLLDLIKALEFRHFSHQLIRAAVISTVIYCLFAWAGDRIFEDVMQIRFAAFQIFGGITFLIIGIRLTLGVGPAMEALKPESRQVSGAIVMPFMVGPGTLSASILASSHQSIVLASFSIIAAVTVAIIATLIIKYIHDVVRSRSEQLIERYVEIAGRVTALFTGSFAIEMLLSGIERWLSALPASGT